MQLYTFITEALSYSEKYLFAFTLSLRYNKSKANLPKKVKKAIWVDVANF